MNSYATPKQKPANHQVAARDSNSPKTDSPQAAEMSQLETVVDGTSRALRDREFSERIEASARVSAQRQLIQNITDSPHSVAQRKKLESISGIRNTSNSPVQLMGFGQVIQRVITPVSQPTANTCWAAVGYAVHRHAGGAAATLRNFVSAQGTANALTQFDADNVLDIDEIIGSQATTNRLTGSDSAGSYGKAGITTKLNAGNPIVANVNSNHYIILTAREIVNGTYRLTYMDPASGSSVTADAVEDSTSSSKITGVGGYTLSVLYYTG